MKGTKRFSAMRACLALATIAVWVVPGMAHASTPVVSLLIKTKPVTPYNSGAVQFTGHVSPIDSGTKIAVTATDHTLTVPSPDQLHIWYSDDPGNQKSAGDFDGIINVTELGTHDGTASTFEVDVQATLGSGETSPVVGLSVTKQSADPQDIYAPVVTEKASGPPSMWCHTLSYWHNGDCQAPIKDFQAARFPFPNNSELGKQNLISPKDCKTIFAGPLFMIPSNMGGFPCTVFLPNGQAAVQGGYQDLNNGSFGIASEIKDVSVRVLDSSGKVVKEYHQFVRQGTRAFYYTTLEITDYPPGDYTLSIQATDAIGNKSSEVKHAFTVEPDGCPSPPIC